MLALLIITMVFASINITIVIVIILIIVSIFTHKVFASKKARPQADPNPFMLAPLIVTMAYSINFFIVIVIIIIDRRHKAFASKKARSQADPLDEDMEVRVFRRFITVKCEQIINEVNDVKKIFFTKCEKITR